MFEITKDGMVVSWLEERVWFMTAPGADPDWLSFEEAPAGLVIDDTWQPCARPRCGHRRGLHARYGRGACTICSCGAFVEE